MSEALTQALEEENLRLKAEIKRLQARLEIDYWWHHDPDNPEADDQGLVRQEIPEESKSEDIDGISCRDATIESQEGLISDLKDRIADLHLDLDDAKARNEELQRYIDSRWGD